jgi:hypothetical protein
MPTLGHPTLDRLDAERQTITNRLNMILDDAAGDERDLDDDEQVKVRAARDRLEAIDTEVELIAGVITVDRNASARLAALPTRANPVPAEGVLYRTGGDLLYDMLHQADPDRRERFRTVITRAAQHMGTDATTTTATAGDLGGLHVSAVVGPVFRPDPNQAQLTFGLGATTGPAAFTFERPRIVDGLTPVAPDAQALEKGEVASRAFTVESDTLKYTTLAQYINISQQLLSWQPGSLQVILEQMRRRQAKALDAFVLAEIDQTTGSISLESTGDAAAVQAAIAAASQAVYEDTGSTATWIATGPAGYYRLMALTDAAGRPLFPAVGPANALGTAAMGSVMGLNLILTPAITDGAMYVGNGTAAEVYLSELPVLEAVEPSVLGRQVALGVGVIAYRPTDIANAIQKIEDTTP